MRDFVAIAYVVATLYLLVYVGFAVAAKFRPAARPMRDVLDRWLWAAFLFVALGNVLFGRQVWAGFQFAFAALILWTHRNDDHWKKLRNRVDSVVRDLGHRLTIAPAPIPVRADS